MKITAFKIFIVALILTMLGVFIIPKLSVRLNPTNQLPTITVHYNWANASPYILEREVTSVLESGLSIIKGLKNIKSRSSKGSGYITLEFDKYTNLDMARFEVATIIRQLYKQLPEQASYPVISVNKPDEEESRSFLSYSISAPASAFAIQETVKNNIEPVIGSFYDVDKTQVYGAQPKEYLFSYDYHTIATLQITKQDLVTALQNTFNKVSLGAVLYNDSFSTLSLKTKLPVNNWHIPVNNRQGKIIYLDEITTVNEQEQETQSYYRINGKNAITLAVYATKNANTLTLAKKIDRKIQEIKKTLPKDYTILKVYDSTEYLNSELNKIYLRTFYTVIILLLFIVLISKSVKYLVVTVLSLITNLGIAFLLYYIFGIQIQLYSLAGITISLGLIIDNSIVMIDHIRHQHNKKVVIPILASTLTSVGALSIIYFLDEKYKVNLIDFALVIIINLSVSVAVALFFIPALLEKINLPLKKEKPWVLSLKNKFYAFYKKLISVELRFKKLIITSVILIFGIPFFMLPQKLENNNTWYEKIYNNTIGTTWYTENLRPYVDKYLGGTFRLFSHFVFESSFYNTNEETKLYVTASMEKGATIHQMNDVFLVLENYLLSFPEIKQFTTQIYSSQYAQIEIVFNDASAQSTFPFLLKSRLIRKVLDFGGINWNIYGVGTGFSSGGGIAEPINFSVKAKGYNYDALNAWADTLKQALLQHPRIQKVLVRENSRWQRTPSYQYRFSLDKERLALAGVSPKKIVDEIKSHTLSKFQDLSLHIKGKYYPVRLESKQAKQFDVWHIKNVPLDSLNKPILLKDIATITKEQEEENIYKENQEYIRLVEFQYTGAAKFGSKYLDKKLDELKQKLPLGYSFERSERFWYFYQDKNTNYGYLLFLILCIIYFICAVLFESLKQPFIILSIIPVSFIGVFLTFYLFDFNFDQGGLASFVLLSGITVNASIFIVNGFNGLKKEFPNKDSISLYVEAFKQKIVPITITIISTVLGFVPFIKDGQNEVFWFALGVGTIGGLLFSLLGILFYLPVFSLKKT